MAFIYATVRSLLSVSGYLYNLDILNFPKAKALNATYNLGSTSGSGPSTETPARMQEKRSDNNRVGKNQEPGRLNTVNKDQSCQHQSITP